MTTRFLLALSLVITLLAVWFYQTQGDIDAIIGLADTNIDYEATDILAIQTNVQGRAEYTLTADSLTHYAIENVDELNVMTLLWRTDSDQNITIKADQALMDHIENQILFKNNVLFVSQNVNSQLPMVTKNSVKHMQASELVAKNRSLSDEQMLTLKASELVGNLTDKTIHSDDPIIVQQANNTFEAARFKANLNNGDYEFNKVAVTFMPPKREDIALF